MKATFPSTFFIITRKTGQKDVRQKNKELPEPFFIFLSHIFLSGLLPSFAVFVLLPGNNRAAAVFIALLFRRRRKEVMPNIVARADRRLRPPFVYGCAGRMSEISRQPEWIRFATHYDDIDVFRLVPRSDQCVIRDFGPGGVRFDSRPREWKHKVAYDVGFPILFRGNLDVLREPLRQSPFRLEAVIVFKPFRNQR